MRHPCKNPVVQEVVQMNTQIRALTSGTIVHERYQIRSVLGAGGFGITYEAWDIQDGERVALKEYIPLEIAVRRQGTSRVYAVNGQQEQYERFRTRFLEEARVIWQYREHPNIIHVKHLFYENNTAYYAMEFLEGNDLSEWIKRRSLSWEELVPVIRQTVEALSLVHQSKMIHCDVSPDNIFIQKNGQVKVIDFGAAKHVMKGQSSVIILKKGYAPPEQFATSGRIGPWTDVYALAVTIYQAYTGKMPPAAPERLVNDTTWWPSQAGIRLPSAKWEEVMKKGMALRIEDRYQSVREFFRELIPKQRRQTYLEGIRGSFYGRKIPIEGTMYLGTDTQQCKIIYPAGSPGVSRTQFRIWESDGKTYIVDTGSRYGTFLSGTKMTPGLVYELDSGMIIEFGEREMFRVSENS